MKYEIKKRKDCAVYSSVDENIIIFEAMKKIKEESSLTVNCAILANVLSHLPFLYMLLLICSHLFS